MQGIKYILTWVSQPGACVRCQALNGKNWELDDLDAVPLLFESESHPHCRCELDVQIDVDPTELQVW